MEKNGIIIDIEKAKQFSDARIKAEMYCREHGIRPFDGKKTIMYSVRYIEEMTNIDKSIISKCENGKDVFPKELEKYYQDVIFEFLKLHGLKNNLVNNNLKNDTSYENKLDVQKEECINEKNKFKNLYNHSEEDLEWLKKIVYESDYIPQLMFYVPSLDNFIKEHKDKYPKDVYDAFSRLGNDGALIMSVILAMRESNSDLTMGIINKRYFYLDELFGPTE